MDYEPQTPEPEAYEPSPSQRGFAFDPSQLLAKLRQPRSLAIATAIAGLLFGWLVIGWWLYPVEFIDGNPAQMRADYQQSYLRAAIDSYTLNPDETLARGRLQALGAAVDSTMASVAAAPGSQSIETIAHFQSMLGGQTSQANPQVPAEGEPAAPSASGTEPPRPSQQSWLVAMCAITLALGGVLVAIPYLKKRQGTALTSPFGPRGKTDRSASAPAAIGNDALPLSQWMTTYLMGDDLFDDSFSIDSPAGEFMGECGVGVADTIGVGTPKRVTAFEIWLFDKNDIQTVTKVLMSSHIFREDAQRNRLSAKGEPALCSPGVEMVLETATLQMVARVVDMQYGEGALPEDSFFERVTLELAVWSKS
ncbi:MAG: hypothetical protein KIS88_04540 [Anaerolineales bacterium]|nr:hypothetical protein [Anaerolineales bacterium]